MKLREFLSDRGTLLIALAGLTAGGLLFYMGVLAIGSATSKIEFFFLYRHEPSLTLHAYLWLGWAYALLGMALYGGGFLLAITFAAHAGINALKKWRRFR